ncbi:MAG: hypothetical protein HC800_09100 [Phormidesmis sp. RL_2_1]|nr:hypothetical protein [Phormidesmis sp. RL_2_1]
MAKTQKQKTFRWQSYRPLLAAAFAVAGVFNLVGVVIAAGTPAGTPIDNTATATYSDSPTGGTTINATSNTVTIQVAEVAGLTAVPSGFEDVNGNAIEGTDELKFSFTVTNTGNDATDIFIPGINNIITQNFDVSGGSIEIFPTVDGVTPSGPAIGTVLPPAGDNFSTIIGTNDPFGTGNQNVPPDGRFIVTVTGNIAAFQADGVTPVTAGNPIGVTLGNTPPNDNTAATQNQDLAASATNNDLRTIDIGSTASNGVREASASDSKPFAASNKPLALATVLKTSSVVGNNPTSPTDDQITYTLGLRVENTVPAGNIFLVAPLEGTEIQLNGGSATRILVSDAIPVGTTLQSVVTPPPGSGWTPVYATTAGTDPKRTTAWSTTAPTNLATVQRVGFIHNGPLAPGYASTSDLRFTVVTSGLPPAGDTVNNIAQVFGESVGDTTNQVIYDESGDQNPNNFDGNTPPDAGGDNSGSEYPLTGDPGIADPVADEVDTAGNNTGTGPDGEVNQVNIIPPNDDILNGPNGQPGASGPTDSNDDFTNQSTAVPAGIRSDGLGNITVAADTFNPDSVRFNNTLNNPAAGGFLANVTLQPLPPQGPVSAESADGNATTVQYGTNADIPDGTIVTIKQGTQTASYSYTAAGGFVFAPDPVTAVATTAHINVGDIPAGGTVNYTVDIDLPTSVALDAVGIPIIAFTDTAALGFTGETTNNITIDRLYTGFMRLIKDARVLRADGTQRLPAGAGPTFQSAFNLTTENIAPDEFIEYRIRYENISTPTMGAGNVILNANNFVLTENGTTGGNTWATTTTHRQNTVFKVGTTMQFIDLTGPTVTSDPVNGTKVDSYVNTVGLVIPGPTNGGSLLFRRQVN